MNIIETGAELLVAELGLSTNLQTVIKSLSELLGDGVGDLDLAALVGKMTAGGGLESVLASWLGDDANSAISTDKILELLGSAQVADFAGKIGTDTDTAARGLADVIPQIMDQASSAGSLMDAGGGMGGLLGSAKSFLT